MLFRSVFTVLLLYTSSHPLYEFIINKIFNIFPCFPFVLFIFLQASVHRPRHVGIKRNENNTSTVATNIHTTTTASTNALATTNNGITAANNMQTGNNSMAIQRPSYQQYQQQRRLQFQQQHIQKQMHLQQPYQVVNIQMNGHQQQQHKFQKPKGPTYELQFQQQPPLIQTQMNNSQQQQQQNQGLNQPQYLAARISNSSPGAATANRQNIGQLQQPQHTTKTRIPVQHQRATPTHQQQHQNHQQQQQHATFNQISKNATNLLNDIYERNLLNHTTFQENEQHQLQFQQQQPQHHQLQFATQQQLQQKTLNREQIPLPNNLQGTGQIWLHKTPKTQIHTMKLPAPPQQSPPPTSVTYQLSDSYVDPVDTKKHFLSDAHNHQPPPPPAPLNHVYETIKERPPIPPPPPERNQNMTNAPPPPLPPSRLLKKKLMAAAANNSKTHKSHKKSSHDKDSDKKAHNKMLHVQPPAYVAPPPLLANGVNKILNQYPYSLQQRTKADGEHRAILYQQLREQNQKIQQQQQDSKNPSQNEINEKVHQQQHSSLSHQQHQANQQQQYTREHPLGAHDESVAPPLPTQNFAINNNPNNFNQYATLDEHDAPLSVEHTLQQAGLLPQSTSSTTNGCMNSIVNNNGGGSCNNNNRNNRPSALPIVFEEDTGEFQDVLVLEEDGTAKLPYRHGKKIEVSLETAQAMAAAAYYAR